MIDKDGYRPNVGIVLCNAGDQVLWARRCGRDGWQFPQGGVRTNETVEQAMYRELREEIGLKASHVQVIGRTRDWLRYDVPAKLRPAHQRTGFKGQKQIWFLLRFLGQEQDVLLNAGEKPEFDSWRWVDYWSPIAQIIDFKREVYRLALTELEPLLNRKG